MFRNDLRQFIEVQLIEMATNVSRKSAENIVNRAYNPFSLLFKNVRVRRIIADGE